MGSHDSSRNEDLKFSQQNTGRSPLDHELNQLRFISIDDNWPHVISYLSLSLFLSTPWFTFTTAPPPHHPPKPHPLSTAPVSPVMGNICCLQRIIAFYLTQSFCLSCSPPVFIFTLLSRSQTQYLTKHRTDIYGPTGICRLKERNGKERKGKGISFGQISQVSHLDFSLS